MSELGEWGDYKMDTLIINPRTSLGAFHEILLDMLELIEPLQSSNQKVKNDDR